MESVDRKGFLRLGVGAAIGLGIAYRRLDTARAAIPTPARGGVLVLGTNVAATDTPDPAKSTTPYIVFNVFEPPIRSDPLFNLSPAGCIDWSTNKDATVWTFKVRPDLEFSNGQRVSSADYAYTITRALDPATVSPFASTVTPFLAASGIATPDTSTLRLTLLQPHAFFDVVMSGQQFGVVPNNFTSFQQPISAGPFTLQSFQAGTNAVLKANPNYWRSGLPYLDEIQVISLTQESARLQSLLAGNIQLADGLPTSGQALASSSVAQPVIQHAGSWCGVHLLGNQAPFNNPQVVQAVQYSLNRLELLETTSGYGRHVVTPDFEVVPPGDFFYPGSVKPKHYDPDRAQSLLSQAGFGNGLTFNVYCAAGNVTNNIAVAYQSIAKASNIQVNVVTVPGTTFSTTTPGTQNIARSGPRQHVAVALGNTYYTGGSTNFTHYSNPSFDKLYLRLLSLPNNQRAQLQLVADMCELITTTWAGTEAGAFDRVIGKANTLQGLHDVRNVLDEAWLQAG